MIYLHLPSIFFIIVILFGINHVKSQKAWGKNNFPNPMVDLNDCGQNGKPSWICDPGNVLTEYEVQTLNDTANDLKDWTCVCYSRKNCWYKMAVAVVPSMLYGGKSLDGSSKSEKLEAANDFAKYLNKHSWDFGNCNDDLVVLVAVKERQVWTTLGSSMQDVLSAECVNKIFQDNKEFFTKGDFGQGVINLLKTYRKIIVEGEGSYDCSSGLSGGAILGIVLGSLFGALFVGMLCCCCCGCCKGGGGGRSSGGKSFGRSFSFGDWGGGGGGGGGGDGGGGSF